MICNDKRYIIFLFDVGKGNTGDVGNYGLLEKTKNHNTVAVSGHPNPTHRPGVPGHTNSRK